MSIRTLAILIIVFSTLTIIPMSVSAFTLQNISITVGITSTFKSLDFMLIRSASSGTAAIWNPAALKFDWDSAAANFCPGQNACLVNHDDNSSKDGQPSTYFMSDVDAERPRCINDTQYILDHVCKSGQWSSRTADIFLNLATLAQNADPSTYSITCSNAKEVFNDIDYVTSTQQRASQIIGDECTPYGSASKYSCINNACVTRYKNGVAFGASLNEPITSEHGILSALNLAQTFCDNVPSTAQGYSECSPAAAQKEHIYYNPSTESIIFVQNDTLPSVNIPSAFNTFITPRYTTIIGYITNNSDISLDVKKYFLRPQEFAHMSLIRANNKEIFGFKAEGKTQTPSDFVAIMYTNVNLGQHACTAFIKRIDSSAYCERQPTAGTFFVVGKTLSTQTSATVSPTMPTTLANAWIDMTAKIRP